jgi:hypothetical protein
MGAQGTYGTSSKYGAAAPEAMSDAPSLGDRPDEAGNPRPICDRHISTRVSSSTRSFPARAKIADFDGGFGKAA